MNISVGRIATVTVVLLPEGTSSAVDFRGDPIGTRETDLLGPENLVQRIDAVCLSSGGSAGLAAADGVVRWLSERGRGFPVGALPHEVVPIVPAATVASGAAGTADDGYAACEAARDLSTEDGIRVIVRGSIGVVAVDAVLSKAECRRVAVSAQDGLIRASGRGGTVFVVATGPRELPSEVLPRAGALDKLCTAAAKAFEHAMLATTQRVIAQVSISASGPGLSST